MFPVNNRFRRGCFFVGEIGDVTVEVPGEIRMGETMGTFCGDWREKRNLKKRNRGACVRAETVACGVGKFAKRDR